ncbi:MAG: UDP-2,4-diacetamido-2,4,6-trideoxy-beta-L-altropyranose hydrolase [Rhodobacteraceae bacterium]|nr:UDP-2,4-diacetamido-2,4,6-trideoxy-beta-L-altropyranose hydrolase [Paracoccaceae bacterium]
MQTILFRADGSSVIGVGHIVRCATLASELKSRGIQVHLAVSASSSLPDWVESLFPGPIHSLNPRDKSIPDHGQRLSHSAWLHGSQQDDALQTQELIKCRLDGKVDSIVVDHYGLDARWHRAMHQFCSSIMAIDDLADRKLDVSVVLDQNRPPAIGEQLYRRLASESCFLAMGPKWALIRNEFKTLRSDRKSDADEPRILLMSGGSNIGSLADICLEGLLALGRKLQIDVIVGASDTRDELMDLCQDTHHQIRIHVAPERPARIMASADLAISSAGSTTWELACLGVPALLITVAENQIAVVKQALDAGTAVHVPSLDAAAVREAAGLMIEDRDRLNRMERAGRELVDGEGAVRIADLLLSR